MSDSQERTEDATEKHFKEVRSKGKLQKSRDLTAWISIAAGALMIPVVAGHAQSALSAQFGVVHDVIANPSTSTVLQALSSGLESVGATIWPMLLVVALATIVTAAAQGGIHARRFEPKFEQFNVLAGIRRLFGARTAWEGVKTLGKALVVGLGFFLVLQTWIPLLVQGGGLTLRSLIDSAQTGLWTLLRTAIAAGLVFSGLDVFVVVRRNRKTSRMTKREVKDENKNTEGDPLVRAHRRSRQMSMSRNRMIQAVANADVVVVNPTHVAVALRYEPGKSAPRVVAKGADLVADRIRQEAVEQSVPMVRDVPLARALHASCELGQEIPVEFFTQVAHVIAFVMALKKRGTSLGDVFTLPGAHAEAVR